MRVDLADVLPRAALHFIRQRLDKVRPAQRVRRVRHAALVRDNLLRAQRQRGGKLGRQRPRLVQRIRVQRLRPAHHRGQRLQRRAHHVVVGLLRRERASRRLRVEAQRPGARDSARRSARVIVVYQMRRAARYLAISSKKSLCALKKNESRGANSSTSIPRACAHSTYSIPSRNVNASS